MIRYLLESRLQREEQRLGGSLDYLRHIAASSLTAFLKFAAFTPLASHRKHLPAEHYHAARIMATLLEDCGSCVQMEVNLAVRSGVRPATIQAVLDRQPEVLDPSVRDAVELARAVVERSGEEAESRHRLQERFGEPAVSELAIAIATCRVFPTVKRALGYAVSCERVAIRV